MATTPLHLNARAPRRTVVIAIALLAAAASASAVSSTASGATGLSNAKFFGRMPTIGNFAVVSPDGMGRQLRSLSYGYAGQIDDLARMPRIVERALPWVRIDR